MSGLRFRVCIFGIMVYIFGFRAKIYGLGFRVKI